MTQSPVRRLRAGFTLIELLVVIAIIAILAAILFPVFAQARAKARQTADLSNNKEVVTAWLEYVQDYDETMPIAFYDSGIGDSTADAIAHGVPRYYCTTNFIMQPYYKTWQIFEDPAQNDGLNIWGAGPYANFSEWARFAQIGYNGFYLSMWPVTNGGCSDGTNPDGGDYLIQGVGIGNVTQPAQTIAFADSELYLPHQTYYNASQDRGWFTINPPNAASFFYPSPSLCIFSGGETAADAGTPNDSSIWYWPSGAALPVDMGNVAIPHNGGTNVSFTDGHCKWLTPGQLAAGTNFGPGVQPGNVVVTDPSKFLWDLKKDSSQL